MSDLFKSFCIYYNISEEQLNKFMNNLNDENELSEENKRIISNENELFQFLRIISIYIPKFKLNVSMDYNCYINEKLNINYLKSITKSQWGNKQKIMLTQSVIFEFLSTKNIEDCGLITNFNFKYITNIDLNSRKDNSIRYSLFNFAEKESKEENKYYTIEENNKNNVKIIWKEKNKMLDEFENSFENDDYLKKEKLITYFDSFIINVYYKYLKKIISVEEFNLQDDDIKYSPTYKKYSII